MDGREDDGRRQPFLTKPLQSVVEGPQPRSVLHNHAVLPMFRARCVDASGVRGEEPLIVMEIKLLRIPLGVV